MRRRRVIIVLAVCIFVSIAVVALWPTEPEYNGKKLSEWCLQAWPWMAEGSSAREEACKAIEHIGTNALPFLVRWLQYDHPSPREKMADLLEQLKARLSNGTITRNSLRPLVRADIAVFGFEALGTNAGPAIPSLTMLIRNRTSSTTTTTCAAEALAFTGAHGVQVLGDVLSDPTQSNRRYITAGLVHSGLRDPATAQVFMHFAQDVDTEVAVHCAGILGRFRPAPAGAVASLKKALNDPRPRVRVVSIDSLANLGAEASSAVPEIAQMLRDSDPMVRHVATNALLVIASDVLTNGTNAHPTSQ